MSGIRSTSGSTPTPPVETSKGTPVTQQVNPVAPSSAAGGQTNPEVPHSNTTSTLSEGSTFSAIVTARARGGDTMLHTEVGNFRMSSGNPIPVGSHVVLELQNTSDLIIARVISINGEKLAAPPTVTLIPIVNTEPQKAENYGLANNLVQPSGEKGGLQNITTALGKSAAEPTRPAIQNTIPKSGPETSIISPPKSGPLANSSFVAATLGNTSSVQAQAQHSGTAAYAHTINPGPKASAFSNLAPGTPSQKSAAIPQNFAEPGKILEVVRATIDHPPLSQRVALPSGEKQLIAGSKITVVVSNNAAAKDVTSTGIVISHSGVPKSLALGHQTQVHVQTASIGTLRYTTSSAPAVGSQVSFTIAEKLQQFPITTAPVFSSYFKTPHLPIMTEWDNLRSALNMIAADNPQQAVTLLNTRIPSPNSQLGANLLFFLTALNGGNINKWLGQDFQQSLERMGQRDLFRSLSDEFTNLGRINSETGGQDWKTMVFPFYNEDTLRQLRMFYRQHKSGGGEGGEDEGETRFVIELDLSKTGPVQLDGLFKRHQFDLVFRSQRNIEESIKTKVSNIFRQNIEITGLKGTLTFRQITPFPLHPTEEWEGGQPDFFQA
ncbi:MAG: hypothetical protein JKY04_06810 [Sneathiella sp.]|nr:hypothetical protein [Sneathiella sp.]